ncbi:MAG: hypothetical protein NFCOHLIN_03084 [Gammaproteobacteria bacterium]|nr:hypothetical protein [Gammaproteobacteria bacterium]
MVRGVYRRPRPATRAREGPRLVIACVATPDVITGHLLPVVAATACILTGIMREQRDLIPSRDED